MKVRLACFLLGVVLILPIGAVGYLTGRDASDSAWEYKTQYLQEELESCHLRDKFEGLRH